MKWKRIPAGIGGWIIRDIRRASTVRDSSGRFCGYEVSGGTALAESSNTAWFLQQKLLDDVFTGRHA